MAAERVAERFGFEAEAFCDADQDFDIADVFAASVECLENARVKFIALALGPCPVRSFVCEAGTRLYGRQDHRDAQTFGERKHRLLPGTLDIFAIWIERRDRFGTQLEGAPNDLDVRVPLLQFVNSGLRQPTERSDVIGENFEDDFFHIFIERTVTLFFARGYARHDGAAIRGLGL